VYPQDFYLDPSFLFSIYDHQLEVFVIYLTFFKIIFRNCTI